MRKKLNPRKYFSNKFYLSNSLEIQIKNNFSKKKKGKITFYHPKLCTRLHFAP